MRKRTMERNKLLKVYNIFKDRSKEEQYNDDADSLSLSECFTSFYLASNKSSTSTSKDFKKQENEEKKMFKHLDINKLSPPYPNKSRFSESNRMSGGDGVDYNYPASSKYFLLTLNLGSKSQKKRLLEQHSNIFNHFRKPTLQIKFDSRDAYVDLMTVGAGAVTKPPITKDANVPSYFDIAPRTNMLILSLLLWSAILSLSGVILFLFDPTFSGYLTIFKIHHRSSLVPYEKNSMMREVVRAATLIGQWHLPAQILLHYLGPVGVLLIVTIGLTFSSREIALRGNIHRYLRGENYIHYGLSVLILTLSINSISLSGYWIVYRYSPPSICRFLCYFCRISPFLLAVAVCLVNPSVSSEVMMPLSILSSIIGGTLIIYFGCIMGALQECLPTDNVFLNHKNLKKNDEYNNLWGVITSNYFWNSETLIHLLIHTILFAYPYYIFSIFGEFYVQYLLQSSSTVPFSKMLALFYGIYFIGKYILPIFCDKILGLRFSRLDFLTICCIPLIFLFPSFFCLCCFRLPYLMNSNIMTYIVLGITGYAALFEAYMISISRAVIHYSCFNYVMNTAETLAISGCLILNHLFYFLSLSVRLLVVFFFFWFSMLFIIFLWGYYRDYGSDKYGYPLISQLLRHEVKYSFQENIPTVMIPLWVLNMSLHEVIQRNYYQWNLQRIAPSDLQKLNLMSVAAYKAFTDDIQKHKKTIQERIAL